MKLSDVLFDSINYAEKGFPVSEIISNVWSSKEVVENLGLENLENNFSQMAIHQSMVKL